MENRKTYCINEERSNLSLHPTQEFYSAQISKDNIRLPHIWMRISASLLAAVFWVK
jgi:hypothetical protein